VTAAWMWARTELRARWRSWVVLGLLAGATAGVAAAAVAGARRTDEALPRYIAASGGSIDAAVLANDPTFDARQRAAVAALPEVRHVYPFSVAFLVQATKPRGLGGTLLPHTGATALLSEPVIVEGRHTDPSKANEATIDENAARRHHLDIGSTIEVAQVVPAGEPDPFPPGVVPPGVRSFRARLRVVGIFKSVSSEENWTPSSGFWDAHRDEVVGVTNVFARLRHGEAAFPRFQRDVQRIVGHPVNVARGSDLLGLHKLENVLGVERDGLLLFAFAVVLGGGVLVGQALVRAVTASGSEFGIWRAMGADRPLAVRGMVMPTFLTTVTAAVTAVAVAIAVSPRFPIGVARRYELDVGIHAVWLVFGGALLLLSLAIVGGAAAAAWWRVTRGERERPVTSTTARWATAAGLPPALLIGSRLAVEPGRGRRAVPVRSALVGAIVGVLGVVACFTFRAGIEDAAVNPTRSGVVWDYIVAAGPAPVDASTRAALTRDADVAAGARALWARAVPIDGVPTPTFGIQTVRGTMNLVMLAGRAPQTASEIAFGPTTASAAHVRVGDEVRVGMERRMRVVGLALLPSSSHTGYDESAWMTLPALRAVIGPDALQRRPDDFEDYLLLRWRSGVDIAAAERRVARVAATQEYFAERATLPTAVVDLGHLGTMPLVLAIFFGLLACATVAHALVTTVRRRRYDLAVLRAVGFTRRQSRLAIAWQATALAIAGIVVGVPLGLVAGRVVWRWVAEDFPVAYVPPVEVIVVLLVIPIALALAQALAAGPAHAAARIHPAETLRAE
jgi:FtsX-like permease family